MSGREFQTHKKKLAFCDEEVDAFFQKKLLVLPLIVPRLAVTTKTTLPDATRAPQ